MAVTRRHDPPCYAPPPWKALREQWYRAVRSGDKSDLARRLPALGAVDEPRRAKSQPVLEERP